MIYFRWPSAVFAYNDHPQFLLLASFPWRMDENNIIESPNSWKPRLQNIFFFFFFFWTAGIILEERRRAVFFHCACGWEVQDSRKTNNWSHRRFNISIIPTKRWLQFSFFSYFKIPAFLDSLWSNGKIWQALHFSSCTLASCSTMCYLQCWKIILYVWSWKCDP